MKTAINVDNVDKSQTGCLRLKTLSRKALRLTQTAQTGGCRPCIEGLTERRGIYIVYVNYLNLIYQ